MFQPEIIHPNQASEDRARKYTEFWFGNCDTCGKRRNTCHVIRTSKWVCRGKA